MRTVQDILDAKGHSVWWIDPLESVFAAAKMMHDRKVGVRAHRQLEPDIRIVQTAFQCDSRFRPSLFFRIEPAGHRLQVDRSGHLDQTCPGQSHRNPGS
jgi:hypothetical protein